jgi:steroid delta-isomerase-like uncharacterized protein
VSTAPTRTSREVRDAVVREHIDAENRHEPDAVVATFSPEKAAYDIPAMGEAGQQSDAESVRQMWIAVLRAFPDFHIDPGPYMHGDDHVFVEITMSGTQAEEFGGIPSSGRSFETRVACLYEFEGDDLVRERVYMDWADITRQLTVSPA